jgi:hypothetical protein
MTDQNQSSSINDLSIKYGLLIGLVSIVLSGVVYVIDPLLQFKNFWIGIGVFILVIVLLVLLGLDVRKKIGGFWSFADAFKSLIIMSIVLTILTIAYNFIIYKFVDPQLPEKANSAMLETLTARFANANMSQDKIDEYTKSFQNGEFIAKLKPTAINELKAFGFSLILYGVISLIIAASIKKKEPLYASSFDEDKAE